MISAVRSRMAWRTAISELWARWVAERPPAHGLFQFDDCDPDRHRKHDAFNHLQLGVDCRLRMDCECGRAANHPVGRRDCAARRPAGRVAGKGMTALASRPRPTLWRGRQGPGGEPCQSRRCGSARARGALRSGWRSCPPSKLAEAGPRVRPSKTLSPRSSRPLPEARPFAESGTPARRRYSLSETRTTPLADTAATTSRGPQCQNYTTR